MATASGRGGAQGETATASKLVTQLIECGRCVEKARLALFCVLKSACLVLKRLTLASPTADPTATIARPRRHCRSHCHVATWFFNTPHSAQGVLMPFTFDRDECVINMQEGLRMLCCPNCGELPMHEVLNAEVFLSYNWGVGPSSPNPFRAM